jgi:hypothetical protein
MRMHGCGAYGISALELNLLCHLGSGLHLLPLPRLCINWDRIAMGNAMSRHVLVVVYMSEPIPLW